MSVSPSFKMPTKTQVLVPKKSDADVDDSPDAVVSGVATSKSAKKEKKKRKRAASVKKSKQCPKKKQNAGNSSFIDITDVPPQPLILKNGLDDNKYKDNSRRRPVKASSSKYTGVYYDKVTQKWKAQIMVDNRVCSIGYYTNEEDAAGDYAKAAFKYKARKGDKVGTCTIFGGLDLSNIPEQQTLITSSNASSGYKGVKKMKGRWQARISIEKGKVPTTLGTFDTVEEAARIYARAAKFLEQKQG